MHQVPGPDRFVKEGLRSAASRLVVHGGLARLGRRLRRAAGCLVVYGHRVADDDEGYMQGLKPAWLDEQLGYLARHFEIIPLAVLVQSLRDGRSLPRQSAVLTFDDGFRDNYEHAFPLLEKYRAPATIFAVTASLDDGQLPWSQRLGYLFQHTGEVELAHPLLHPPDGAVPLASTAERRAAYQRVKAPISRMGRQQRDAVIDELAGLLRVEAPRDRMMSWSQAREMQAAGVEIGAHTRSHPLLANIPLEEARAEMAGCRADIERELGVANPPFCFPAGSYSAAVHAMVRELGFASCFVPDRPLRWNRSGATAPYSMVRVGLPNAPGWMLEAEIDGPFQPIRRLLGRGA